MQKNISVKGAREHNLRNIDIEIPRDRLVVFTGLSGSGKSSLAFDTIYAEGQRRYVESLSAYARQFLEMMQKPDVDHIDGLSPAISIEQRTTSKNPRSTVGTVTEIYDYLRLLYARSGIPYSPATGLPIKSQTVSQMADRILGLKEGTRLFLLGPIARGRKGEFRKELAELQKKGFQRVKVDGKFYDLGDAPQLDKKFKHDIDVVVDRIVVSADIGNRLPESIETALNLSDGLLVVEFADEKEKISRKMVPKRLTMSSKFACPVSGFTISEIEPRLFSFNNPHGACPECDGLGTQLYFDPDLVVPDPSKTMGKGAIAPWSKSSSPYYLQTLDALARHYKFSLSDSWEELSEEIQEFLLYGSEEDEIKFTYDDGMRRYDVKKPFEGIISNMDRRYHETESAWVQEELERYQSNSPCEICEGYRLKPEALCVKINKLHIGEVCKMSIRGADKWFKVLDKSLNPTQKTIAARVLKEIRERLKFLNNVWARISHALAFLGDIVGRREPAHSPCLANRLRPYGRIICSGRALYRAPSTRQSAAIGIAQRAARSRQYGNRSGA